MRTITPESRGISSAAIERYVRSLEDAHLAMHNLVIARGDEIIFKTYYPPFTPVREHRLYSETKSFVAIAVGFAIDDRLLTLDDKLVDHFPVESKNVTDPNVRGLTVRNMLMMATAGGCSNWFTARCSDRVQQYFTDHNPVTRPGGTSFAYDSSGSFVVGALVERLTGKTLVDYLTEKLFDPIGVTGPVRALKSPGGHTWGDSAFLMRAEDVLLVIRFLMNGGRWNGKQLLSRSFVREATANLISTGRDGPADYNGYGYYIWKFYGEGYYFGGMGCQYAVAVPEKDMIFVCNADNQGNPDAKAIILNGFWDMIVQTAGEPLPDDPAARASLDAYCKTLKLFAAYGDAASPIQSVVSGKCYTGSDNPMDITRFTLSFHGDVGALDYTNAQGDKRLLFGMCANVFQKFPQAGYADQIGSVPGDRLYDCAVSAAWKDARTLWLKVQIIDDYFGNMDAIFSFSEDGVYLKIAKTAEDFLDEYQGEGMFAVV